MGTHLVRIVGTGEEYATAQGERMRNFSKTVPLTRTQAAELLRHYRRSMVRGFLRTIRVERRA